MKNFGGGTIMLRPTPFEAYLPDWLAVPWDTAGGRVCVCDEPIPDNSTYFQVFFQDVNFVAVAPITGDPEDLLAKHFRRSNGLRKLHKREINLFRQALIRICRAFFLTESTKSVA
jgi:hypothetical protein